MVVPVVRPVSSLVTAWLSAPASISSAVVLSQVDSDGFVLHSNHTVVAFPLGDTVPLSVAPVRPTDAAGDVVTDATALGTKLLISPRLTPLLFLAATR